MKYRDAALVLAVVTTVASGACSTSPAGGATGAGGDDSSSTGPATTGTTSSTSGGVGGGVPAVACLDNNCVGDSDCANGYRCNNQLMPPKCQELYCGESGTICSQVEDCVSGLKCLAEVCVPQDACLPVGSACDSTGDCCSKDCQSGECQCLTCAHQFFEGITLTPETACPETAGIYQAIQDCECATCAGPCAAQCGGAKLDNDPCATCLIDNCSQAFDNCMYQ